MESDLKQVQEAERSNEQDQPTLEEVLVNQLFPTRYLVPLDLPPELRPGLLMHFKS